MRQLVIDYFTKQSGSDDIINHYNWFMHADLTVLHITRAISTKEGLFGVKSRVLATTIRDYIDEMDDAAGNV